MSAMKQKHKHLLNSCKETDCGDSSVVVIVVFASDKDVLLSAVLALFTFWLEVLKKPNCQDC